MKNKENTRSATILLVILSVAIVAIIAVLFFVTRHDKARDAEAKARDERVSAHINTAYPNKWLLDEELTDRDEHYIRERLNDIVKKYEERTVTVRINKNFKKQYSMEDLKDSIALVCTEGENETVYPVGREDALAKRIVNLDKDLSVEEQDDIITGKRQTVKAVITVRCTSNREKVTEIVKGFSEKFDKAPKNATITSKMKVTNERDGRILDTTLIAKDLNDYLDSTETENLIKVYRTTTVEASLKASYLRPIKEVLSSYSTYFINGNTRGKNIHLGASRLNGTLVKPNEEISFLDILYDKSDHKSYGKAGGFLKNKVVQVEGGGICQVSTTSYNAFLRAGIIPVERHPHTCKVTYATAGLDAALAVGTKDLVVKNTLETPILVRAVAKSGKLTISILSYKNAKKGFTYKARAMAKRGSLIVKSYLDTYKGGKKVSTTELATDTYKRVRG